jgi:hypothetical protein
MTPPSPGGVPLFLRDGSRSERAVKRMKKSKGRRKVGRKKRRMRAKIRHRK